MLKIFRIKDTETGLYFSTGKYSYSEFKMTKRGRIYTGLQYIRDSLNGREYSIYWQNNKSRFPNRPNNHHQWKQDELEYLRSVTDYFPSTWVITDERDVVICTVNELTR